MQHDSWKIIQYKNVSLAIGSFSEIVYNHINKNCFIEHFNGQEKVLRCYLHENSRIQN